MTKEWSSGMSTQVLEIVRRCSQRHGVTPRSVIVERSQEAAVVRARHAAIRELATIHFRGGRLTVQRIGQLMGGMHHSTVVYALGREKRRTPVALRPPAEPYDPRTAPADYSGEWDI